MNILIIGNGGREHAIAEALSKIRNKTSLYFTHNGGANNKILNAELPNLR